MSRKAGTSASFEVDRKIRQVGISAEGLMKNGLSAHPQSCSKI